MSFGIKLEVWGEYASFNRPEMKVERASYDIMTPSAARGILEAIYWKPEMRWVIEEIHVLKPIRFTSVRRNEISRKISVAGADGARTQLSRKTGTLGLDVSTDRQQRAATILRDVRYGICAHIDVLKPGSEAHPAAKHLEMFKRRASRGQHFHHPYLGTREFPAHYQLTESFSTPHPSVLEVGDLGWMLHDIVYFEDPKGRVIASNTGRRLRAEPRFFRARLEAGVLRIPPLDPKEVHG